MEGRKSRTAIEAAARHPLAWILLLAALVRLCTLPLHGFHHPDEIFQYLEQAHRLAIGYGVVPWEYRAGIRHWLLPILLSGPMWLGEKLGGEPSFTIPFVRGFVALVSLTIPLSLYVIGRRISPLHGMLAGLVGAVWYELVHFSTHPLSEPFALSLIMPAFAIAGSPGAKPRILALAGLLFGLAILVRFQMAPAIATLILVGCWSRWRETFLPLALGGAVALLIGAAVDLATGIVPYSWVWKNFAINIGEGRAATYGVSGPFFYLGTIASVWSVAILLLFPLAWAGARRQPALFAAAVVHLLLHSLIGHKEYRFVLFTTSALVLLAALGSANLVRWIDRTRPRIAIRYLVAAAAAIWVAASAALAVGSGYRPLWTANRPALQSAMAAGRDAGLCGLAIYDVHPSRTGGYSYLGRPIPIFLYERDAAVGLRNGAPAYNMIMTPFRNEAAVPGPFGRLSCTGRDPASAMCLYRRSGRCSGEINDQEINRTIGGSTPGSPSVRRLRS